MEELRSGLTAEERERIDAGLSLEGAAAFYRQLTPDDMHRLGVVWRDSAAETDLAVLFAQPIIDHRSVIARFAGFGFAPKRSSASGWQGGAAGWYVSGYLERGASGDIVVRQLAIDPERDQQGGVTTDVLRSFRPTNIIAKVRAYLTALPALLLLEQEWGLRDEEPSALATLIVEARAAADAIPAPRGRLTDDFFERLARLCLDEFHLRGRGVLDRVADAEKRPRETIRDWVREATERGFLAPRERGQSVFAPGWRLQGEYEPPRTKEED